MSDYIGELLLNDDDGNELKVREYKDSYDIQTDNGANQGVWTKLSFSDAQLLGTFLLGVSEDPPSAYGFEVGDNVIVDFPDGEPFVAMVYRFDPPGKGRVVVQIDAGPLIAVNKSVLRKLER